MSDQSPQFSFPEMEEKILSSWNQNRIFEKSLKKKGKAYSFYDGPPFATGLPHYGHLLASTLKDIIPRYWTMRGYQVPRRWGWDCHGLPIEQEIDKKHQFKSTEEIEKFGIAKYNEECRAIVLRFASEWERVINRLGRWADFKNDYKTMDLSFMESVWWVFHELWEKKLIYRGYKVMSFSTALGTPLSNFEASSNYQNVQDPAITVMFPLKDDPKTFLLAWTTTPWTLPANLALAVGKDISYVRVKDQKGQQFILAETLVDSVFKKSEVEVLDKTKGANLVGLAYEPLFPYFASKKFPHFSVIAGEHVTEDSGTGIVHTAPGHGEDDFYAGKKLKLDVVSPVDKHGKFTSDVGPYAGQYVKDADKAIIQEIKQKGRLLKHDTLTHAYPFCPRTDTPLIMKAVSSWFVSVEKIKERLMKNNEKQTRWIPEHLRDGRFGKWLENARDWAISRNRYWGNPLPIWEAVDEPLETRETFCLGSIKELEKLSGQKFTDLHREHLDDIEIVKNGKKFRRVPEVLDCWFESGSMPYAQSHYPFENKKDFEANFPADFIGEGLDQTRGWFYTLSVLGTILFDKIPFKNVVVNGLILAEDGKKMSKRLKNYPDPMDVMHTHGADALRMYLIDSPVIRAEELRFSEKGVREIVRRVLLKVWNAASFYDSYAKIDKFKPSSSGKPPKSNNILDRWMLSRMQSLLASVEREMEGYRLYNVVPELLRFIEELTNTYIRLNRPRFWEEGFSKDKEQAFATLHYTLLELSKVLAPFTPFFADHLYLMLTDRKAEESVHLDSFPRASENLIDPKLEEGVALLEEVILLGRNLRENLKMKVKIPSKELVLVHRSEQTLKNLQPLEHYLRLELNARKISYETDEKKFVSMELKPNLPSIGPRAGKRMKAISDAILKLSSQELAKLEKGQKLTVDGDFEITSTDVRILRTPVKSHYSVNASPIITVALDPEIQRDQELEGLSREVVSRIQKLRKESGLQLDNRIRLQVRASGELHEAVELFRKYISDQTLAVQIDFVDQLRYTNSEVFEIENHSVGLALEKI